MEHDQDLPLGEVLVTSNVSTLAVLSVREILENLRHQSFFDSHIPSFTPFAGLGVAIGAGLAGDSDVPDESIRR